MSIDFRPIGYTTGILLLALGFLMWVPALIDFQIGNPDWQAFAVSSAITVAAAGLLILGNPTSDFQLTLVQGFVLTTTVWVAICLAGALPFMFGSLQLPFTDAAFESISGFTTTGSTVITGLDNAPPGLLLWRSLTQWIGGIGIIVMAITMLPFLRIGGMQLFRTESSDRSEKISPNTARLGTILVVVYVTLTGMCMAALVMAGMNGFDALCHAMTTLATGGFSTKDASIGFYASPAIEAILVVFMTAGALPLVFYARFVGEGRRALSSDAQVWEFLVVLCLAIAVMTVWLWWTQPYSLAVVLRLAAFNVTSIMTDTGFATSDFGQWGDFAIGCFFVFYFIGGCAGSTAGAIKIFRWHIMLAALRAQMVRMVQPSQVILIMYNGRLLGSSAITIVMNFFFIYLFTFAALSLALMMLRLDFLTSVSAIAQAMANAGPGLGDIVGPAGNFAALPAPAKWIIALAMLLGRLELLTVYVILLLPVLIKG